MDNRENKWLRGWHTKIAILLAIMSPTVTATGAFYGMKNDIQAREAKINERVLSLELSNTKEFADKQELSEIHTDVREMRKEISELKNMLIRRR
jgi:hypothetical protein